MVTQVNFNWGKRIHFGKGKTAKTLNKVFKKHFGEKNKHEWDHKNDINVRLF